MHPANIFFCSAIFFLFGVLFASLGGSVVFSYFFALAVSIAAFITSLITKRKKLLYFIPLLIFVSIGSFYFKIDHQRFLNNVNLPENEETSWQGVVLDKLNASSQNQEIVLALAKPHSGRVLLKLPRYPNFEYGDILSGHGKATLVKENNYGLYLMKERVAGIIIFPEVELISSGGGSVLKSALLAIKKKIITAFEKALPQKEAAFLAGITLGERGDFSKEFKEAMSKSGTTHLVALSGYNITVIVSAATGLFLRLFGRRTSLVLTLLTVLGFVIMTGAEKSVVRAAIMGSLILFSREIGRMPDFRNTIALAALLMTLENPKVLLFDIGFQLSFLAVIGIIYLKPALEKILKLPENKPGIFSWRENLMATFSAQVMTAPLLITQFGNFSLVALISNVIILEIVPLTMTLGFSLGFLSFLSYRLSLVAGWLTLPFLWFETRAIEFFGKISVPFDPAFSLPITVFYYGVAAYVIYYGLYRKK
jgi:competence protein ComEC